MWHESDTQRPQLCSISLMCSTEIRPTRTNLWVSLTVSCRYSLFTADLHFMHSHSRTWVESIHWFGWIWLNMTAAKTRAVIKQHAVLWTLWMLAVTARPGQLAATAVFAVSAGHWKRTDELDWPTKTVKEKAKKLSSTMQYKTYTTATNTTGKLFSKIFIVCRFLAVFFSRGRIVSEVGVVCVA